MKELSSDELSEHFSFIKRLSNIYAVPLYNEPPINSEFVPIVRADCEVVALYERDEPGFITAEIVCPSCGSSTKRKLKKDRYDQYVSFIMDFGGNASEDDKLSFMCISCLNETLQKDENDKSEP
jgi:hypothetical protein